MEHAFDRMQNYRKQSSVRVLVCTEMVLFCTSEGEFTGQKKEALLRLLSEFGGSYVILLFEAYTKVLGIVEPDLVGYFGNGEF